MSSDVTEDQGGTTRRRVLKRVALGAGAAWAAPMVVGTSSALADPPGGKKCIDNAVAADPPRAFGCVTCPSCNNVCGSTHEGGQCCCFVSVTGCCFCGVNSSCLTTGCVSNANCPPGNVCAYTCCSPVIQCVETCLHHNKGLRPLRRGGRMQGSG
jgi:hypothetical protein